MSSVWHDTRIIVVVTTGRSRLGRPTGGLTEAHCVCGWYQSFMTYAEACAAADEHMREES